LAESAQVNPLKRPIMRTQVRAPTRTKDAVDQYRA